VTAAERSGVCIRAFTPGEGGDEGAVVEVWARAAALAHPFLESEWVASERTSLREVYLPRTETWVAEADELVVGFVSLHGSEIGSLFVEPAFHRHGIGRALLDRAREQQPVLDVQVYEANAIGRAFYARTGFEFVDSRVQEATGEVLLRLRLGAAR
jgi:putative acetyltransferase